MKKILGIIVLLLTLITTNVNAQGSFTISLNGSTNFNNTITLELKVNSVSVDGACSGICGLSGKLNYDTSKVSLISKSPSNGFDLTEGTQLVMLKNTGVGSGTTVLTMTFKNIGLANGESTTISFTNAMGSDGDSDIGVSNATKSIKYVQPTTTTTKPTSTRRTITTTKKNNVGSENTTTTTTSAKKDENSFIKSISVSEGNINFNKEILSYDIIVGRDTNELDINAILESEKATITGSGNHKLEDGLNVITLKVTAEDLSTREYTINVYKDHEVVNVTKEIAETPIDDQDKKSNSWLFVGIPTIIIIVIGSIVIIKKQKNN